MNADERWRTVKLSPRPSWSIGEMNFGRITLALASTETGDPWIETEPRGLMWSVTPRVLVHLGRALADRRVINDCGDFFLPDESAEPVTCEVSTFVDGDVVGLSLAGFAFYWAARDTARIGKQLVTYGASVTPLAVVEP